MEKEREYESLTETFEKIVLIIYPTLIFPRVLGTFSLGRWEKDERIGGAIKRFFSILFFFCSARRNSVVSRNAIIPDD